MRILLITNLYPSKANPSYGIFVKNICKLLESEHELRVVAVNKTNNKLIKIIYYFLFYTKAVLQGLFGKYDCIYAHYISHCALPVRVIKMFKKNIRVIGNVHGEDIYSKYNEFKKNEKKAALFLRLADCIIVPSDYFQEILVLKYGYSEEKIFVSPSGGVSTKIFFRKDLYKCRNRFNLSSDAVYVGYVSRIEKGKGWDDYLRCMHKLIIQDKNCNIRGLIVGNGTEKEKMLEYVKTLNLEHYIDYFSSRTQEELCDIYNSMNIFCFPTKIETESLGLVGLEAMACGCLCVISNCKGPSSYAVNNDNCVVFEHSSYVDLYEKCNILLNMDEDKKENMRIRAISTAAQFSSQQIEKNLNELFIHICEEGE